MTRVLRTGPDEDDEDVGYAREPAWPGVVALIVKQPRTVRELAHLLGIERAPVDLALRRLEGEGLVESTQKNPGSGNGPVPATWTWIGGKS